MSMPTKISSTVTVAARAAISFALSSCPASYPSAKSRLPRAAKRSSHRPCRRARASCHFLSTATRSLPRGTALSGATRTARSCPAPRTADRVCPWGELAPSSRGSRLLLRAPTTSRPAQFAGSRCLLPARHLPVLPSGRVVNLYGRSVAPPCPSILPGSKGGCSPGSVRQFPAVILLSLFDLRCVQLVFATPPVR